MVADVLGSISNAIEDVTTVSVYVNCPGVAGSGEVPSGSGPKKSSSLDEGFQLIPKSSSVTELDVGYGVDDFFAQPRELVSDSYFSFRCWGGGHGEIVSRRAAVV